MARINSWLMMSSLVTENAITLKASHFLKNMHSSIWWRKGVPLTVAPYLPHLRCQGLRIQDRGWDSRKCRKYSSLFTNALSQFFQQIVYHKMLQCLIPWGPSADDPFHLHPVSTQEHLPPIITHAAQSSPLWEHASTVPSFIGPVCCSRRPLGPDFSFLSGPQILQFQG